MTTAHKDPEGIAHLCKQEPNICLYSMRPYNVIKNKKYLYKDGTRVCACFWNLGVFY